MVISKSTAVVHPRPCIKEAMVPPSTLPRVRTGPKRVAELPSLRYGSVGASYNVSGPLRVKPPSTTLPRYTRSFTTGVVGDVPVRTSQVRRVRFTLPVDDSPVTYPSYPRSRLPSTGRFTPGGYSGHHHQQPPVQAVTVVSGTTANRERAHQVSTYVRGTLAPTATTPPGGASDTVSIELVQAARENDEEKIRQCVKQGVGDANAKDSSGRTALSYIASNGSIDILESILQLPGIDPNLPDNEGNTPLHFAAQAGQVECLNYLLSRCEGLEIDARNHLGFTPLMKAALQGRNKCAKLLLFAGANPTLRDTGRGLRAEQWARYCGRYVCADVIEKFARHRLLERSTSCGRWGSDSDIGATRLLLGKVVPVPNVQQERTGIKSKLRKVFRTSSGPSNSPDSSSARLVTQLTSAALCASSPVLPAQQSVPPVVKSLIRPLTVPRLQITLANGAANVTSDLTSLNMLLDQDIEKPPRIKKKMK